MRIHIQATSTRIGEHSSCPRTDADGALYIDGLRAFLAPHGYLADGLKPVDGSLATFNVSADRDSVAGKSGAVSGRYIGHDPQSTDFAHEVRMWLADCIRAHERCRRSLSGALLPSAHYSPLPTRCLDVGTDADQPLRLVNTAGEMGTYATLSHRWNAQTEPNQTTALNYEARMTGFSASDLSKTFRDAVDFVRRLEIRYLWIDSLCIIQGEGSDDWAFEAGRMAGYYQGSMLTLAAASDSQEIDGLSCSSPNQTPSPLFERRLARLDFLDSAGCPRGYFYVFPTKPVAPSYEADIRRSALMRRGWVFQEWLLSRRIVYFTGSGGVYLECQTELPRNSYGERLILPDDGQFAHSVFSLKRLVDFSTAKEKPERLWWDLVEMYSALELSFPAKDRLLALSGVLAEFSLAQTTQSTGPSPELYVSGLWLSDLHRSLLWHQLHRPYMETAATTRVANMPSWSWTSFHGPVTWNVFRRSQALINTCKVLEMGTADGNTFTIRPEDLETYTETEAVITRIRLRCKFIPVTAWEPYTSHELDDLPVPIPVVADDYANAIGTSGADLFRKIALASPTLSNSTKSRQVCGWASFEDVDFQDQRDFADGGETFALHVLTSRASNGWMERGLFLGWKPAHYVIFVRRVDSCRFEGTHCRRIGMGALWGKGATAMLGKTQLQDVWLV